MLLAIGFHFIPEGFAAFPIVFDKVMVNAFDAALCVLFSCKIRRSPKAICFETLRVMREQMAANSGAGQVMQVRPISPKGCTNGRLRLRIAQ